MPTDDLGASLRNVLTILVPVGIGVGGLWILYNWLTGKAQLDALLGQHRLLTDAFIEKIEGYLDDGTIDSGEQISIDEERDLIERVEYQISEAVKYPWEAVYIVSGFIGAAIFARWGVIPALDSLYKHLKGGIESQQYQSDWVNYEYIMINNAVLTGQTDPIKATQQLTAISQNFTGHISPLMQSQVIFLQTHMAQFTGYQLIWAQYMVNAIQADIAAISTSFIPFGATLIPVI